MAGAGVPVASGFVAGFAALRAATGRGFHPRTPGGIFAKMKAEPDGPGRTKTSRM